MATWTRKALRRRLGGNGYLNDLIVSNATSTGGTALLVNDTSLTQGDGFFNSGSILIASGTYSGEERRISTWASNVFTVTKAFTGAIASGVEYEVHRLFSPTAKHAAINNAIYLAKQRWPKQVVDTSLTQTDDVYAHEITSLSVPIDVDLGLDEVRYEMPGLQATEEWPLLARDQWYIYQNADKVYFQTKLGPMYSGYKWKLIYRVNPPQLSSDTSALVPDDNSFADYVCAMAASLLCGDRSLEEREDQVKGPWTVRMADWREIAGRILVQDRKHKRPGKVKFTDTSEMDDDAWRQSTAVSRMRVS